MTAAVRQKKRPRNADDCFLAMDVGGTNVIQGLVNRAGGVLAVHSFFTGQQRQPVELIEEMVAGFAILRGQAPKDRAPLALAFGMPGWLDAKKGVLLKAPNMPGWINMPIAAILSRALNLPAYLQNDADLHALGEWLGGAGRGLRNLITLTLGTGVGAGLILEGRLWAGSFSSAGEVGHMPLGFDGALCGCGRRGCLETVASATGLKRLGREWLAGGKTTLYDGSPEDLSPETMSRLAARGDPMSLAAFREAGRSLGLALSSIFNLLGLEGAVIGGGVAGALEYLKPHLDEVFAEHLVTARPEEIFLGSALLGEMAPLVGAAALLTQYGL